MKIKVSQFYVKNQFTIQTSKGLYFQSYQSIIAFIPNSGKTQLDKEKWDYSRTTGKYRNRFLNETKDVTEEKIANGNYLLRELN